MATHGGRSGHNTQEDISPLSQLTDDKIREYQEAFRLYDKNRDGLINTQKLGRVLRAMGLNPTEIEIQEMIDEVDSEGTGLLDFDSFLNIVASRRFDDEDHEDALKEAFRMFDRDGNGYIDAEELRICMINLGEKLTLEEVEEMIREVDIDYDGRMNYEGNRTMDDEEASRDRDMNENTSPEVKIHKIRSSTNE